MNGLWIKYNMSANFDLGLCCFPWYLILCSPSLLCPVDGHKYGEWMKSNVTETDEYTHK